VCSKTKKRTMREQAAFDVLVNLVLEDVMAGSQLF
jgi:hypothetical protein